MLALGATLSTAQAYTQCTKKIDRIWTGDDGNVWLHFADDGGVKILSTDPDKEAILAAAMTALVSDLYMIVRYTANDVPCAEDGRDDVRGVYLTRDR
ncbi:MAG: hypothetical protein AAGH90_13145 [Pseudomonadota bacterium]